MSSGFASSQGWGSQALLTELLTFLQLLFHQTKRSGFGELRQTPGCARSSDMGSPLCSRHFQQANKHWAAACQCSRWPEDVLWTLF